MEKLLESTNIKLSSVVSDVLGVSAKAMLTELSQGATDPQALAELAKGRLRNKLQELEAALTGRVDEHHRFVLAKQLGHIDFLDEQIEELNQEISRHLERMASPPGPAEPNSAQAEPGSESEPRPPLSWSQAVELLDTIPGVDRRTAEVILTEIGLDMSQFPTADDLVSWAGFAPGNHQSGGKRYSGRMTKGHRPLSAALNQAAWAASRTKETFLQARFQRLVPRRGKKRAIGAIGRSILVSVWLMLTWQQPYQELGGEYYDQRRKDSKVSYLTKQLTRLGFAVQLDPIPVAA